MRRIAPVLIALACSAPASAASITYSCGDAVCRVAPDGSAKSVVASGRTYRSPSISLDGRHLAWIEPTADLFAGDGRGGSPVGPLSRFAIQTIMRPDGTQVLAMENAGQSGRICVYDVTGGDCDSQAGGAVTSAGWGVNGQVMIDTRDSSDPAFDGKPTYYNNAICLLKPHGGETGGECERTLAYQAEFRLSDPAVAPSGAPLAVARAPWDQPEATQIAVFDASGAARVLTSGPGDATPAFSPDGTLIAFSRDGGIWVVPVDGSSPERRIADGIGPSWSTLSAVKPRLTAKKTQRGATARGKVVVPTAGSTVQVLLTVKSGKDTLVVGKRVLKNLGAGAQAFSVTLSRKVQQALRGKVRRVPTTVRVTIVAPDGSRVTLAKPVTLILK